MSDYDFSVLIDTIYIHQLGISNRNNRLIKTLLSIINSVDNYKNISVRYYDEEKKDSFIFKVEVEDGQYGFNNEYFFVTIGYLSKALESEGELIINQLSFTNRPENNCYVIKLKNNTIYPLNKEECEAHMFGTVDKLLNKQDDLYCQDAEEIYLNAKLNG